MLNIEAKHKISCIIYKLRVGVYKERTFEMEHCSDLNLIDGFDSF